jgi:beta-lactamase class A
MQSAPALLHLDSELRAIAARHTGKVTFALTDLSTGSHLGLDEGDVMPTASLIKVPVLVALYRAADEGRLALTDRTTYRQEHRCLGSGVLSRMTPGAEMTVRDAATLMIIISDNSATNMCIDLVGLEFVNETMRSLGLERTSIFQRLGDPAAGLDARKMSVSSAGEMTALLTLIARHQAVSPEASEDMLRIMRRQDYRHELSLRLPWNEMNMLADHKVNWVAEKGGSFIGNIRASGAVFHGARGAFAMSVFCEGGTSTGTGRNADANILIGDLGYAAWRALAAPA